MLQVLDSLSGKAILNPLVWNFEAIASKNLAEGISQSHDNEGGTLISNKKDKAPTTNMVLWWDTKHN